LGTHWTEKLFIDYADYTRLELERGLRKAETETGALQRIFQLNGVPANAKVLDLCCGIGRHSLTLAERGYSVTGVDFSPLLINRAEEIACLRGLDKEVRFIEGDMRGIHELLESEERTFDAVINMNTSLGYYTDFDDEEILRQLERLAKAGGLLVIDIANRDFILMNFKSHEVMEIAQGVVKFVTRSLYLDTSRIEDIYEYYEKAGETLQKRGGVKIDHRLYSLHELIGLVNRSGWRFERVFGGFSFEHFNMDSSRIILTARKKP